MVVNSAKIARNKRSREFLKRKNSKKKIPRYQLKYPHNVERDYLKSIRVLNKFLITEIKDKLIPMIPTIHATYLSELRLDGYKDLLEVTTDEIRIKMEQLYSDSNVESIAFKYANETNTANRDGINRQTQELLGIDMFASEPWLETVTDAWIGDNVALIKSIPDQYLNQVEWQIKQGLAQGISSEQMQKDLLSTVEFKKHEKTTRGVRVINPNARAALIVRDQIGKYFGQLTKFRHLDLGVTEFVWTTAGDERVRPRHAAFNGKTYSWAKGAGGVFPGQEIQCRCVAQPRFD